MLAELAHWTRAGSHDFPLFGERPLSLQVQDRPRGFSLFDNERDRGRHMLLATLPYGTLIEEAAERYRLDSLLLAAVIRAESGFDAAAISPQGAQGLMQLMPTTAMSYGAPRPEDPRANVRAGARYLRELLGRFDDDLELALAAYNAGPTAVRRFSGVPPYRETRTYVERVLTLYLGYHRTLWQEAQLDELLGDEPTVGGATMEGAAEPPAIPSGGGTGLVLVGSSVVLPAAQPLTKIADALAEPLAQLWQTRVPEDQQHNGQDDQQLGDAQIEHGYLRGDRLARSAASSHTGRVSLPDRPGTPPTPAAGPDAGRAAPGPRRTNARLERASEPPA